MDHETDREVMIEEATAALGEEMRRGVTSYKERLDRTAVDIDVREEPTVNVIQQESWVDSGSGFSPGCDGSRRRGTRSTPGSSRGSPTLPIG